MTAADHRRGGRGSVRLREGERKKRGGLPPGQEENTHDLSIKGPLSLQKRRKAYTSFPWPVGGSPSRKKAATDLAEKSGRKRIIRCGLGEKKEKEHSV